MENLQELMTNIVKLFGKQIITEKTFVNLLADYRGFKGNNAARKIINSIIAQKYSEYIVNLTTSEYDLIKLRHFAHALSNSYGFQRDLVETIMRMMVFACNGSSESDTTINIEKREDKFGCVDPNGNILIPFEYDRMMKFNSEFGLHIVCVKRFEEGCVYSSTGEMVFQGDDHFVLTNDRCLWIVVQNNKYGAIHPNGEVVIPFIYKKITIVNPKSNISLLIVETETGVGIIDYKGSQILPPIFEDICNSVDNTFEIIEAQLTNRYMYFNLDGTIADVTPLFCTTPLTAETYNNNDHTQPKGYVVNGNKYVVSTTHNDITDLRGNILCSLGKFNDGLAVATERPWIGYMDSSLHFVIRQFPSDPDALFDFCEPFDHGYAIVWKGNSRGIINTKGEIVAGTQYVNIIRRNWCFIMRFSESVVRTYFNGDEYLVGDCYIKPYNTKSAFKCTLNGIFDIGNFIDDRAFAQYRNFVGIATSEGKTIEPMEYEWFRSWNSPKLVEAKFISPVRRNGVWGGLDLEQGFKPFSIEIQERNESRYLSLLRKHKHPIPYFLEYQKDDNLCGFKWSNLFHIPAELYENFIVKESSTTIAERKDWLNTNSVTVLK